MKAIVDPILRVALWGHPSIAEAVLEISSAPNETLLRGVWYKKVSYIIILPELKILYHKKG